MNKKVLERFAKEISNIQSINIRQGYFTFVARIAQELNPRFNLEKFRKACNC